MSDRPLGISVLCIVFGLFAFSFLINGFDLMDEAGTVPANQPLSVEVFLAVFPVFLLGMGFLSLYTAFALWDGSKRGFFASLALLGLWIVEEVVLMLWGFVGPPVVQRYSSGLAPNLVRILIGAALIYYLVVVGQEYVFGGRSPSRKRWRSEY